MDRFTKFHTLSQETIELIVRVRESSSDIEFITDETEQVARQFRQVTTHLQEGLTRSRMVPLATIADRLPRAVRDIAFKYGKQAELHIEGRDTLIDKVILEQLYDPMTHLVNNAITHGIETPEERLAVGKSPIGQITINAFHQGNQTVISVADDGAGIDSQRVKAKAIQKGLITPDEAKTMSRLDVYDLLFHPGFSTKDQTDEFAGRGVGMDVVRTSLNEIRGVINTDSTPGKGTTFTIRLPLTLSICKALCCLSEKTRIAFPMDGVEDTMELPASSVLIEAEGQSCIPWHDSFLPLRPLKELLKYNRQLSRGNFYGGNREDDMISVLVLRSAGTFIAIEVDQVLGEQEIVIKQFEGPAPKPVGVAGATVLGDGRIMPIADVLELIDLSMGRIRREGGGTLWADAAPVLPQTPSSLKTEPTVLIVDDSITVRELLCLTFNKAGYRVEQARDGQEAWDKLRDGLPCDIIFCDIEMPRMDGLELLSRIQKDPALSQLPIAMLTSRGADRHRQMAAQLGASGYFTKPYLEEALLDAAQRMLKGEVLVSSNG
jgi:chemosensory pili system protein ChpA (sensor histidine kinase/response regulator)